MIVLDSLMELTCKRFSSHAGNGEEPLGGGLSRRLQFWVHWMICPFCRRYWEEIKAIGEVQRTASAVSNRQDMKMSDIKRRIKENLRKRTG